jgi:hypothetical protein
MKHYFALIAIATLLLAACGSPSVNTGTAVTSTGTTATPTATQVAHFAMRQTVNVGGIWEITITKATVATHGTYSTPQKAGDVFLVLAISAKNISSQEQDISDFNFTLRDTAGNSYTAAFDDDAGPSLGGKVEPNSPLLGSAVYEVPSQIHHYVLFFEVSLFQSGQTIWDISV